MTERKFLFSVTRTSHLFDRGMACFINLDVLQNYPNPMAAANVHSQEFPQRNGYYTHIIRK